MNVLIRPRVVLLSKPDNMTNVLTASFSNTKETVIRSTSALLTRVHTRTAKGFHLHCRMLSEATFTQSEGVLYKTYIYKYSHMLPYYYRKHTHL